MFPFAKLWVYHKTPPPHTPHFTFSRSFGGPKTCSAWYVSCLPPHLTSAEFAKHLWNSHPARLPNEFPHPPPRKAIGRLKPLQTFQAVPVLRSFQQRLGGIFNFIYKLFRIPTRLAYSVPTLGCFRPRYPAHLSLGFSLKHVDKSQILLHVEDITRGYHSNPGDLGKRDRQGPSNIMSLECYEL